MKATIMIKELVKLVGKYGNNVELTFEPKAKSKRSSFTIKDQIKESGWIELTQD